MKNNVILFMSLFRRRNLLFLAKTVFSQVLIMQSVCAITEGKIMSRYSTRGNYINVSSHKLFIASKIQKQVSMKFINLRKKYFNHFPKAFSYGLFKGTRS